MALFTVAGIIVKRIVAKDEYEAEEKFYKSIKPNEHGFYIGFDCVSIKEDK